MNLRIDFEYLHTVEISSLFRHKRTLRSISYLHTVEISSLFRRVSKSQDSSIYTQ